MERRAYRRRRRESDWHRFRRLLKKYIKQRMRENIFAVLLIGLVIGAAIGIFGGVRASAYARQHTVNDYGREKAFVAYEVKAGDTIWGIAKDLAALNPEYNDIRQYVYEIERMNSIYGGNIEQGDIIFIPYYVNAEGFKDSGDIYSQYGIGIK